MTLNAFVAERKRALFEDLQADLAPREGAFDETLLRKARTTGKPQMGTVRYEPDAVTLEFIYPDPNGAAIVLPVRLTVPERIVFLPVPEWVVESIWQGEIDGSFHFEPDARRMVARLAELLEPEANAPLFAPRQSLGRS